MIDHKTQQEELIATMVARSSTFIPAILLFPIGVIGLFSGFTDLWIMWVFAAIGIISFLQALRLTLRRISMTESEMIVRDWFFERRIQWCDVARLEFKAHRSRYSIQCWVITVISLRFKIKMDVSVGSAEKCRSALMRHCRKASIVDHEQGTILKPGCNIPERLPVTLLRMLNAFGTFLFCLVIFMAIIFSRHISQTADPEAKPSSGNEHVVVVLVGAVVVIILFVRAIRIAWQFASDKKYHAE